MRATGRKGNNQKRREVEMLMLSCPRKKSLGGEKRYLELFNVDGGGQGRWKGIRTKKSLVDSTRKRLKTVEGRIVFP